MAAKRIQAVRRLNLFRSKSIAISKNRLTCNRSGGIYTGLCGFLRMLR